MDEKCYEALKKQNDLLKVIMFFMFCILMTSVIAALIIIPRLLSVFDMVQTSLTQMQGVITDLSATAAQLAESDLSGLIKSSQETLDKLDFDGLNATLNDLKTVIEPMARFMGR